MRIDIITLFPETIENFLDESIIGKARGKGHIQICTHQLRDYALNKHSKVDDTPFGGGKGMLLMPEPIACCLDKLSEHLSTKPHIIYMSPRGKVLDQDKVKKLAKQENICIICGHYEGIDERIIDTYVDEEISIGDFVLTGGEMPALILTDAVSRMVKGVLSEDVCFEEESHYNMLLEHPQYTRPSVWRGRSVPSVLTEGNHAKIEKWKREEAIKCTKTNRPKLYDLAVTKGFITEKEKIKS